jgi:lipopolysaccharide transport system permease protein
MKNRRLLIEMAKRDLSDRYAGQILGAVWSIIHPVAVISVFLFLFGVVFRAKAANIGVDFPADQAVYMVSGLIPWIVASEVISRSTSVVAGQAALVKQVVFPIEVLPVKMVIASLPTVFIGFMGLILYVTIRFLTLPMSYLLLPPAAGIFYVFLFGLAFLLSAIGIFFRDIKDIVQIYTLIGLYLAPIFYFVHWVPVKVRFLLYLNPMTYFILMFHDVAYHGAIQSPLVWGVACIIAMMSLLGGAWIFTHLKPQFGSYL